MILRIKLTALWEKMSQREKCKGAIPYFPADLPFHETFFVFELLSSRPSIFHRASTFELHFINVSPWMCVWKLF
jgi:hypothetical protein